MATRKPKKDTEPMLAPPMVLGNLALLKSELLLWHAGMVIGGGYDVLKQVMPKLHSRMHDVMLENARQLKDAEPERAKPPKRKKRR